MFKNQSIEIIKTFTAGEEKDFLKFISSPYFNKSKKLINLYTVLLKNKKNFDSEIFTKEFVYKRMKISSAYNDSTMRNLLADLNIVLRKYLSYIGYSSNPNKQEIFLLKESITRKLNKEVIFSLENLKTKHNNFEQQSFDRFADISEIKDIEFRHFYTTQSKFNKKNVFLGESLLNDTVFYLYIHLLYKITLYENDYIVLMNNFSCKSKNSELHKLYEIISKIDLNKIFNENDISLKYISLFLNITNAFIDTNNNENYKTFKLGFEELKNNIPKRIDYDLCKLATYYNENKIIINENIDAINDSFYFLKRIVENKLYLFSDLKNINHFLFRSVVVNGMKNGDNDWVKEFISEYSGKLKPEYRTNTVNLAYGNYFYHLNDFSKSLKYLNEMNSENRMFNAEAKVLILKIHYETEQYESLKYSIETYFKLFKYDDTFGDTLKQTYLKFLFYLRKLLHHKTTNSNTDSLRYYYENLQKDKNVLNKIWLSKKFLTLTD